MATEGSQKAIVLAHVDDSLTIIRRDPIGLDIHQGRNLNSSPGRGTSQNVALAI